MTVILTALVLTGRSVAFTSSRISRCTLDVFQTRAHTTQIYDVAVYKKTERDKTKCMTRIDFIRSAILVGSFPCFANAANLPQNNGADLSRTGSIETLIPVIKMRRSIINAQTLLSTSTGVVPPEKCTKILKELSQYIPREEAPFKRIFDEYSTPVSYKQKFLDQNAFLVYYSKGFDGPGRPNIENTGDVTNSIQTLQYGFRNEAWSAIDDVFTELEFGAKSSESDVNDKDLGVLISKALVAFDSYLSYAPEIDLSEASEQVDKAN